MKKILFIGMTSNYGGIETFIMNTFRKLRNDNFQFEFIKEVSDKKIAYEDEIIKNGGIIHTVPVQDESVGTGLKRLIRRKKIADEFFKKHNDYDIVHLNCVTVNMAFWLRSATKYGVKKCIIHSHIDRNFHESKVKLFISEILGKINQFYINSNKNIFKLAASKKAGRYMFHSDKFQVVVNGINVEKYKFSESINHEMRKNLKIPVDYKVVITVARIDYQKNYPKIINVFKKIHKFDKKTVLVIVGTGAKYNEILSLVKKYNLEDSVKFLGIRKDVNKLLSIADLMLMPSLIEAFPFSLIEAQSAGVPAVVSKDIIPEQENITGKLKYISLQESDEFWAEKCLDILHGNITAKKKDNMYLKMCDSNFNLNKSIHLVEKIYLDD